MLILFPVGLAEGIASNQLRWRLGVNTISGMVTLIRPPRLSETKAYLAIIYNFPEILMEIKQSVNALNRYFLGYFVCK